jgi:hypothetical protein
MYAKLLQRKKSSLRQYKNKFRCAKLKIKHLEQQLEENNKKNKKLTKFMKWSNDTLTKALKLKFACGSSSRGSGFPSI